MLSIEEVRGLKDEGALKCLGRGCFGEAYLLPDNRVLKVGHCVDGTADWIALNARSCDEAGEPLLYGPYVWYFEVEPGNKRWWAIMERVAPFRHARYHPMALVWNEDVRDMVKHMDARSHLPDGIQSMIERHGVVANDCHGGNFGYSFKDGRLVVYDPSSANSTYVRSKYPLEQPKTFWDVRNQKFADPDLVIWEQRVAQLNAQQAWDEAVKRVQEHVVYGIIDALHKATPKARKTALWKRQPLQQVQHHLHR